MDFMDIEWLPKGFLVVVAIILLVLGFVFIGYTLAMQSFFGVKELAQETSMAGVWLIIGILVLAGIYFINIALNIFKRV